MYSAELEAFFANEVEAPANPVLQKVFRREAISLTEQSILAVYILYMWKRVPRGRTRLFEYLPRVAKEWERAFVTEADRLVAMDRSLAEVAEIRKSQVAEIIRRNIENPSVDIWHGSLSSEASDKVVSALISMDWVFLHTDLRFLTSDNPVYMTAHVGVANPSSELSVPLSSTVALWASRKPNPGIRHLSAHRHGVMEINRRTVEQATRFVYSGRDETWLPKFIFKPSRRLTRLV